MVEDGSHAVVAVPLAAEWVLGMLAEAIGGPGAEPADVDLLGEPIGGRLLFA